MTAPERTVVVARGSEPRSDWEMIDASTPDAAYAALEDVRSGDGLCAVLAPMGNGDDFIGLVSVLIMRGVTAFETSDPQVVQRILDTHTAVSSGAIEVLDA